MEKNYEIKVLDHGFLRYIDHMGSDLSISRNARVSYDAAWRAGNDKGSDTRLIHYLMRNGHNTPFESGVVTFEVKAPIFVIRQWHRHRTQSYNELSARYRELPEEFYVPEPDQITLQSQDNKQMRTKELHPERHAIRNEIQSHGHEAFRKYRNMLNAGCPRELARSVLPVGTYTHMFATANLHNWYRFLGERLHPHAQYEIRVYAESILEVLKELFPVATEAFVEYYQSKGVEEEKARMFSQAVDRLTDILREDDAQAYQEAEVFLELCKKQLKEIEARYK